MMSTFTFCLLLIASFIGHSCQNEIETIFPTQALSSTGLQSTTKLPISHSASISMSTITESYTTSMYTSTPEITAATAGYSTSPDTVMVTASTSYMPTSPDTVMVTASASYMPTSPDTVMVTASASYMPTSPDTVMVIASASYMPISPDTVMVTASASYMPTSPDTVTVTASASYMPTSPDTGTASTPITTSDTTSDATDEQTTTKVLPTTTPTIDPSTPFVPPTITKQPFILDVNSEQRYYFIIPVVIVLVVVILIIGGVCFYRNRSSSPMKQGSRITKLALDDLDKQEPIVMRDLKDVVSGLHRDDNRMFSLHFEYLTKTSPQHSYFEADKDENKVKNRFIDILPFDHSRVILPTINDESHSDYINANFLPGFNNSKEYIATQGPLPVTINDFWRMIWEYNISIIVMLTSCKENGRLKCEQYWPCEVDEVMEYGDIRVENRSSSTINTYTCSELHLTTEDQTEIRVVKHFHYLPWKDMTASIDRHDILQFISTIRQNITPNQDAPIVVHCSAGVGRTGTFMVLDYIMQYIQTHDINNTLDIYGFIMKLRDYRVRIVQNESQYVFIYDCAVDLIEDKKRGLSEILNGEVKENGELKEVTCQGKERTTSL